MRSRSGNATPHSGLTPVRLWHCPAVQAWPALLRASGLRTPKNHCQLGNEVSRLTGDLNHRHRQLAPVSVVYSNNCHMSLGQPLSHLFNLPRAPELWHWDRAHLLGGVCEGSQRQILLFVGLGKCPEQARVLTSSLLAREVLPWQITCFCLWQETYPCYELSAQWYVGSNTITLYLSVGPLITAVVFSLEVSRRTGNPYLITPKRTDLSWDCNSENGKWIRHIKAE